MAAKILILNGSPRKNGNTSQLVSAFTRGAEETGNKVTAFFLDKMCIHGCKGCFGGGKDPEHPCVQRDDMEQIYAAYRAADVVVLASPLYYWTISGQLKTAIDRLFAVAECDKDYRNPSKKCVLLMEHLRWKNLGKVLCGGVMAAGDIQGRPELDTAYQLGRSME